MIGIIFLESKLSALESIFPSPQLCPPTTDENRRRYEGYTRKEDQISGRSFSRKSIDHNSPE
jgi:hypothetical protein